MCNVCHWDKNHEPPVFVLWCYVVQRRAICGNSFTLTWPALPASIPSTKLYFLSRVQVNAFLMKMVQMLGFLWTTQLEYAAEGTSCVNFPEFVTLVTEYFQKLNLTMQLTCELIGTGSLCVCVCMLCVAMGSMRVVGRGFTDMYTMYTIYPMLNLQHFTKQLFCLIP